MDTDVKDQCNTQAAKLPDTGLDYQTKQAIREETYNCVNPAEEIGREIPANDEMQTSTASNDVAPFVIMEQATVQTSDVEADGNDEIVITIADDVDMSLDQVAQGLALSQITNTDSGQCFPNNDPSMVLNNSLNTLRQQSAMSSHGIGFSQASNGQYYMPGINLDPGASYATHNLHHPSMYSTLGGRFDVELERQSCSISSLDQGLQSHMSVDKSDRDSDQDDTKAHPVILDENGDYDSEPLPYHTYSNKDGNIYCYNPKNGKFELEIIDEIVTPLTSKLNKQNTNDNPSSDNLPGGSAKGKKDEVQPVIEDNCMVKLPENQEERAKIVGKMSKGDYGRYPKVVRVLEDGSIVTITSWFKNYMPKRKSSGK